MFSEVLENYLFMLVYSIFEIQLNSFAKYYFDTDQRQNQQKKPEPDAEVKEWAVGACHRCLVYLGDIG